MSVGSNLFLKAALGVAPSCTMALTLSYLSPIHSYALFNFLINSTFLVCEALILHEFGKMQLTQLGLTFVYSLFIEYLPLRTTVTFRIYTVMESPTQFFFLFFM